MLSFDIAPATKHNIEMLRRRAMHRAQAVAESEARLRATYLPITNDNDL